MSYSPYFKKPKIHKYYTKEEFHNLPYGKKKAEFVAWLMRKGVSKHEAINICGNKFYGGRDPFPPFDEPVIEQKDEQNPPNITMRGDIEFS